MSRCPEGHKCIWCGPKVAASRRDARGAQIEDWDDYSVREERAMAAVDEDDAIRVVGAKLAQATLEATKFAPPDTMMKVHEHFLGLMIAGYAFMQEIDIDAAWVKLREHAIAEQVNYETNIKPILDAREEQKS